MLHAKIYLVKQLQDLRYTYMNLIDKLIINDKKYFCLATVIVNEKKYKVMQSGEIFYEQLINNEIKLLEVKNKKTLNNVFDWVKSDKNGKIL